MTMCIVGTSVKTIKEYHIKKKMLGLTKSSENEQTQLFDVQKFSNF